MSPPPSTSATDSSAPPCVAQTTASDASQWFTQEVHPHGGQLKAWLKGNYPSVRDVDDIVQESFLRTWKAKAIQPIKSAKSFLFQVARHVTVDLLRRQQSSPVDQLGDLAELSVLDDRPIASEALSQKEKFDLLSDALASLPERCGEVVMLRKLAGHSQKEVAILLNISERTVEKHLRSGLDRCQEFMRVRGVTNFNFD